MRTFCPTTSIPNLFNSASSQPAKTTLRLEGWAAATTSTTKPVSRTSSKSTEFSDFRAEDVTFAPSILRGFGAISPAQRGRTSSWTPPQSTNLFLTPKSQAASFGDWESMFECMLPLPVPSTIPANEIPSLLRWAPWAVLQVSSISRATTPSPMVTYTSPWTSPTI